MVSLQCELLNVFSISISGQKTWNTGCNSGVFSAASLLPIVDATGLNLCSARHPLLPLICLEYERSLSAHPPALLLHLIHLKHKCFRHRMQNWSHLSLQRHSAFIVIVTSRKHEKRLGSQNRLMQL
jgi:hypothetical protein